MRTKANISDYRKRRTLEISLLLCVEIHSLGNTKYGIVLSRIQGFSATELRLPDLQFRNILDISARTGAKGKRSAKVVSRSMRIAKKR